MRYFKQLLETKIKIAETVRCKCALCLISVIALECILLIVDGNFTINHFRLSHQTLRHQIEQTIVILHDEKVMTNYRGDEESAHRVWTVCIMQSERDKTKFTSQAVDRVRKQRVVYFDLYEMKREWQGRSLLIRLGLA